MTLLNSGTGRHPLSTGRRGQDSRERPRTAISGEAPSPHRADWCVQFWSLHGWLDTVPRKPCRWPGIGTMHKKKKN